MSKARPGNPARDAEFLVDVEKMRPWCNSHNNKNLTADHFLLMWTLGHELKIAAQEGLAIRRRQSSVARAQPPMLPPPGWEGADETPPSIEDVDTGPDAA